MSWFRAVIKRNPVPNEQQVAPLVDEANTWAAFAATSQLWWDSDPQRKAVAAAHDEMLLAVPHCKSALRHLRLAHAVADALAPEIGLIRAIESFLNERASHVRRGRPERFEYRPVSGWECKVVQVLESAGWTKRQIGNGRVVQHVVGKLMELSGHRASLPETATRRRRAKNQGGEKST